ncbi:MAG: serine/threonine-protein kinase [Candidatus Melainabacteria bacterium]|nr:serine/threonine-protein kinase [Candidatus Melainabacteria bacterium]
MQLTTDPIEKLDARTFPLHRYKPVEKLGHGQSGRAMLCFDEFMEQDVVVKTMGTVELDELIEFQREATLLCRINHKGLAQVLDFGCTASGIAYIVSEYHPGVNLRQHIDAGEPLPLDLTLKTFLVITEALAQMHVHGILHRDIKTSNILVRNLDATDGSIHLLDAGTGRIKIANMQPNIFEGREIPGDPKYMCPEQASRLHYDTRSEIFALGCTIFESLTGRTPFVGPESISQLMRRSAPTLTQASETTSFPHKIEAFVAKCLSRSPETRYQSMPEVLQALKELVKLRLATEQVLNPINVDADGVPISSTRLVQADIQSGQNQESKTAHDNYYVEESPVRLVNTDFLNSSDPAAAEAAARSDLSPKKIFGEITTANPNRTAGAQKKPALDSSSIAAPDETFAYFASPPASLSLEPARNKKSAVSTPAKPTNSSGKSASPVVADAESEFGPGFANTLKKFRSRISKYHSTTKLNPVPAAICLIMLICGAISFSYYAYLTAPIVQVAGTVVGYQPADDYYEGLIEFAEVDKLGTMSTTTRVTIESPEQNLPGKNSVGPFAAPMDAFQTEFANEQIWDEEKLNLGELSLTPPIKPVKSDIVLGQRWDLLCRKQWDGKLIVEKLQSGRIPFGQEQLESIHDVISQMVRAVASTPADSEAGLAWATDNFIWEVELRPNMTKAAVPDLFPIDQMKLKSFDANECVMMLKAPTWMTNTKYLTVTLVRSDNWKIQSIVECSEGVWNRK